jgi:fatty acid desaturase
MEIADVPVYAKGKSLKDPQLNKKIQQLRQTDNYTNFFHLAGVYLFIALVIGATLGFYHYQSLLGFSFWWNIPVTFLAIMLVGVGQHRLGGLAHDALHHLMFKNRYLNELVSDWFCMFPIFSITHFFRLEHLGHHQNVNDPKKDPDVSLLKETGYWLEGPTSKKQLLGKLLRLLNIPSLFRYMAIRSQYASFLTHKNPYWRKEAKFSKIYNSVFFGQYLAMPVLTTALLWYGNPILLAMVPIVCTLALLLFYVLMPAEFYQQNRFYPVIPLRVLTIMRMTFISAIYIALTWISYFTGHWAIFYFILLWLVPTFTSFSFFTILQQGVQHANADRGWLTNSRVFILNPLVDFCLFPFGLGYHQPHHMFPSVPHYRLRELHKILLDYPEYREHAVVVKGYLFSPDHPQKYLTVLDGLGPAYEPEVSQEKSESYVAKTVPGDS